MQSPQPVSQVAYTLMILLSLVGMRSNEVWWPVARAQQLQEVQADGETSGITGEPEIDRTDVWAIKYSRYLYHLAHEIQWTSSKASFEIGVVGWEALASQLTERYTGRSIAGREITIVDLSATDLSKQSTDFQILFLSGDGDQRSICRSAAENWHEAGRAAGAPRTGLVVSDAWIDAPAVIDFRRHRSDPERPPGLCLAVNRDALHALGLTLPPIFESRTCP